MVRKEEMWQKEIFSPKERKHQELSGRCCEVDKDCGMDEAVEGDGEEHGAWGRDRDRDRDAEKSLVLYQPSDLK